MMYKITTIKSCYATEILVIVLLRHYYKIVGFFFTVNDPNLSILDYHAPNLSVSHEDFMSSKSTAIERNVQKLNLIYWK